MKKELFLLVLITASTSFGLAKDFNIDNGAALCFDGGTNVRVTNCNFDTSDDAIAITSSQKDKPCVNMTFSNCNLTGIWSAMRIGLLSLGDFESITVTNCTFTNITDAGFKIQMNEGA